MNLSLVTLVLMTVMGPVINLPRLKAILNAVNEEKGTAPSAEVMDKIRDRTLWNSVIIMTMLLVGILFLMTVKTTAAGSVITLGVAVVIGSIAAKKNSVTPF